MTSKSIRLLIVVVALLLTACVSTDAMAACCGGGGTTAHYPGTYQAYYPGSFSGFYGGGYTAYQPVTYQANYSGWYPGYYWDRFRTRMWGSPNTYVAAYPSYATTYTAAYQPTYSVGYATTVATAPACSTCSSCSSCSSYSASYAPCSTCVARPACSSCASPCSSGCSTCGSGVVAQTSYQQAAPPCASCGSGVVVQQGSAPPTTIQQPTGQSLEPQPQVDPSQQATERTFEKPPAENTNGATGTQQGSDPGPGSEPVEKDPYDTSDTTKDDNSTYFQPPKLFDPNDRTAQRSIAPVTTALYTKPASYNSVSVRPVTWQQAEQDAAGWSSASSK